MDLLEADAGRERCLPTFVSLSKSLSFLLLWLKVEADALSEQRVLTAMRHIVAHGALSPAKAGQWQLAGLYQQVPEPLSMLSCLLHSAC